MKYGALRQDYQKAALSEAEMPESPFQLFEAWFADAGKDGESEPNGMVLSTADAQGAPHARVVLLKEVDHGFVWFTNYHSGKGEQLEANPQAAITFWWPSSERQVRIEGRVEKIHPALSDAYFLSRPPGSQAGAIASIQSAVIPGRSGLEQRYEAILAQAQTGQLARPEHWGGYRLLPAYFEFWQGRSSRLHDRIFYRVQGSQWLTGRLSP